MSYYDDDVIRVYRYTISCIQYSRSTVLDSGTGELIDGSMSTDDIRALKMADFVTKLHGDGIKVPDEWRYNKAPDDVEIQDGRITHLRLRPATGMRKTSARAGTRRARTATIIGFKF